MRTHLPRRGAVNTFLAAAIVMGTIAAAAADEPPKLVVVLVVDQMRAGYIDKFQHQWTAGLHRLVTEGAWYRLAAYPYLNTWDVRDARHDRDRQFSGEPWRDPKQLVGPRRVQAGGLH